MFYIPNEKISSGNIGGYRKMFIAMSGQRNSKCNDSKSIYEIDKISPRFEHYKYTSNIKNLKSQEHQSLFKHPREHLLPLEQSQPKKFNIKGKEITLSAVKSNNRISISRREKKIQTLTPSRCGKIHQNIQLFKSRKKFYRRFRSENQYVYREGTKKVLKTSEQQIEPWAFGNTKTEQFSI